MRNFIFSAFVMAYASSTFAGFGSDKQIVEIPMLKPIEGRSEMTMDELSDGDRIHIAAMANEAFADRESARIALEKTISKLNARCSNIEHFFAGLAAKETDPERRWRLKNLAEHAHHIELQTRIDRNELERRVMEASGVSPHVDKAMFKPLIDKLIARLEKTGENKFRLSFWGGSPWEATILSVAATKDGGPGNAEGPPGVFGFEGGIVEEPIPEGRIVERVKPAPLPDPIPLPPLDKDAKHRGGKMRGGRPWL